jgi:GTPase SAR1 family protein
MQWILSAPLIAMGFVAAGLTITVVVLAAQRSRLRLHLQHLRAQIEASRGAHAGLSTRLEAAEREDGRKAELLDNLEKENEWFRQELEKRPKATRKTYKILTLGISGTGKTALTLKWANPLTDLGALAGTKIDRYERTVSHITGNEVTTEHVFEIGDWGGEYIVDAHQELVMDEIHGLLLVVDLAGKDAKTIDPERIQRQLREFQPEVLKFFFGPKTVASCKTVVLFINKSDLLPGTPAEVERQAHEYYRRLVEDLQQYKKQLDVYVLVGSATYGHSTHHLFSHFVERILPKTAYDAQLLKLMKADAVNDDSQAGAHVV